MERELWEQCRAGDAHAREEIALSHLQIVEAAALRVRIPRYVDRDELRQWGAESLLDAIDTFDAARGRTFDAYARYKVKYGIIDKMRMYIGDARRHPKDRYVEFTEDVECSATTNEVLVERAWFWERVFAALDSSEARVIGGLYLQGRRLRDIAAECGLSESWASLRKSSALRKLRRLMWEDVLS